MLDASAFVDAVFGTVELDLERVETSVIFDVEVVTAIRRQERRALISPEAASAIIEVLSDLQAQRHPVVRVRARIWELRHNITPPDASYVALAEALNLPLVTTDLRLAVAAEAYCDVIVPEG